MNWKLWAPLTLAVTCGSGAAYLGWELVRRPAPRVVTAPVQMAHLVVAARPVAAGTRLSEADLTRVMVPPGTQPPAAFSDATAVAGLVTRRPLYAGQWVTSDLLAGADAATGLAALIRAGHRALTLEVDAITGREWFLQPGSRVDVVVALRVPGDPQARTIAQNLEVLLVNGLAQNQSRPPEDDAGQRRSSVTLMVTPEEAAAIELASSNGSPRLVLRADGDGSRSEFAGLTLAELTGRRSPLEVAVPDPFADERFKDSAPLPVATVPVQPDIVEPIASQPPNPRQHVIEVIRGGSVTRESVPAGRAGPVLADTDRRPAIE